MTPVDIVIPVSGGAADFARCLRHLLSAQCTTPHEIVVVNDASTEPELVRQLAELKSSGRVTVIEQPARHGHAAAVNRAFGLHRDRDVVVLHTDAEVANDWLDRLAAHAAQGVGAIGTFTNSVGVATYPVPHAVNALPTGQSVASLDALFARANSGSSASVPTVDGPCLYFPRACLNTVGGFDAGPLGSDYGVEIDFCLRAGGAGYSNLLAGDVFVGHAGHGSFGVPEAEVLAKRADEALARLYPGYRALCADVDKRDPGRPFARRVDLLRLAESSKRILVFVSHPWGGGIRRYMHDLAALTDSRCEVLYLEPAVGDTVKLSWPRAGERFALYFTLPAELPMLAETMRAIGVERLHFHHLHLLPRAILELPSVVGVPYDYTLHDYHPICPQYHLVTEEGRYCGEPDATGCAACLAKRPGQWNLDITAWRSAFARLVRGANRLIAPSQDVATRIRRYVPGAAIEVWPHPENEPSPMPRIVRVAVLGNLSPEKGLHVVAALSRDARQRGLPLAFRILGSTTEPIAQAPEVALTIYGQYVDVELPQLIAAEKPDVLLFAAQVPETYAYTLSVALGSGLPIVASELGAFPERLARAPRSTTVPWDAAPSRWNEALLAAAGAAGKSAGRSAVWKSVT